VSRAEPVTLASGFSFPESPRWHDGAVWFSDLMDRCVYRIVDGTAEVACTFEDMPSGLGFLPDGTPLVAGMRTTTVFAIEDGKAVVYADVSGLDVGGGLNDMVVDGWGRAYMDLRARRGYLDPGDEALVGVPTQPPRGEGVLLVRHRGDGGEVVATDLLGPNGLAVTPDGSRLIVAESFSRRVVSFPIEQDGRLGPKEVIVDSPDASPDGICLDAEGGIWLGAGGASRFDRVLNGSVVDSVAIAPPAKAVACVLGGDDGRMLIMAVSETGIRQFRLMWDDRTLEDARETSYGRIDTATVDVSAAGWP
jgi:sugar lactone lactonase YvrE